MASADPLTDNDALNDVEQLFRHTVPVFDFDRRSPKLVGTGVYLTVDGYRFIITAAHVFEPLPRRVAFGRLGEKGLEVFGSNMRILQAKDQTGGGDAQRARYTDGLDFAVIEPTSDILDAFGTHYWPFDLRLASHPIASWVVVSGWPARKNIYNTRKKVGKFDTCYHIQCPIVDVAKVRATGWNTDIYMGLLADKAKDFVSVTSKNRIQLPDLEGMSGSGVWTRCLSASGSDSKWGLVGILVEDHPSKRMFKVIKIEHLWAPLAYGWGLQR